MEDHSLNLFQVYINQINPLFQKSISEKNAAWFLYKNKARSLIFMLEALTRLVNNLIDDKEVKRSLKKIKKIEDRLGRIDERDTFLRSFEKNKKINRQQLEFLKEKLEKAVAKLNEKLIDNAFYQNVFHDIMIEFAIDFNDRMLILKLKEIVKNELDKCYSNFLEHPGQFNSVEEVHELRRKLRWISMYAQSLTGIAVLRQEKPKYKWEKKFITKAELISPYNKLVEKKAIAEHIVFNKKAFFALSNVISRLGGIKDTLLQIRSLSESLQAFGLPPAEAVKKATHQMNCEDGEKELLKEAHKLLHSFFIGHRIHEVLIV